MKKQLREFFANLDLFEYPQPLVASAVDATLADLNQYRKRGYIMSATWEYDGRVTYTGRGLIVAGLENELAWSIGPKRASEMIIDLHGHLDAIAVGKAPDWQDMAALITGQGLGNGPYVTLGSERDLKKLITPFATLFLPLGRCIDWWAWNAEQLRTAAEG